MANDTHRCIAGEDCRGDGTVIDNVWYGALTEEANTLCPVCHNRIQSAVKQLPDDWANLRAALGERTIMDGERIRSSPTAAILISTRKEAIMAAIVDMSDRAAAVVSRALNTGQPVTYKGKGHPTRAAHTVSASVAITEPNIDLLAKAPPEPALVWRRPERCEMHSEIIAKAENAGIDAGFAYELAGACDECNGWGEWGQERELVEMSGLDIALEMVELHNLARAEMGLTRLRHRYPMPCPRCGKPVGRDDGQTIVTCNDQNVCKGSWTEGEYQFLAGLITRERLDMEISKWLLAEAYARLDEVDRRLKLAAESGALGHQGAGEILAESIREAIAGHLNPEQRAITTAREDTQERQTVEDTWAFGNEPRYQPPKPKPKPAPKPVKDPIHPQSLTTLIDIDEDVVLNGDARCPDCNLIPCDC